MWLGKDNTGAAFAAGSLLSTAWYASTSYLMSGHMGHAVSVFGAIAIAGLTPTLQVKASARRAAQKAALPLSQRLEALEIHTMVNIVDNQNKVVEVNEKFIQATGYTREELIGQPVSMLHTDTALSASITEMVSRGETWQGETILRCADGKHCYTQATILPLRDEKGNWIGTISVRTDVTQVHRLLEKRAIAETLHELRDDVWIVNAQTQRFSYMNKAAQKRMGWGAKEYTNHSLNSLRDRDGCDAIVAACRELNGTTDQVTNIEVTLDGRPFHVSIKYLVDDGDDGRYLILLNDITDRIEQEAQKGAFVSTVSHELRSPLTSIKGSMGLLLANAAGEMPEQAKSLLEISHRNANRLILIINDILDLEKISSGAIEFDIQNTDMSAVVREANESTATLDQRFAIEFCILGADEPCYVRADPNRTMQVLTNFLSNACKFSPAGSRITIEITKDDENVRVAVKDEGTGIALADQHKVFERFADLGNSDRASKGGTGLGLSICKAIIEGMGGTIGFDTREGCGSTFYFTLPRSRVTSQSGDVNTGLKEVG